jgi:hypothetical protein
MTPKAAEALELSILKWKKNAQISRVRDAKIYGNSCALCTLFAKAKNEILEECAGCPVSDSTGKSSCSDSPWEWARRIYETDGNLTFFHLAALAEVVFLESLRDLKESEGLDE